MATPRLGIRAKLNLGLAIVLLGVTAAFGIAYALLERRMVLDVEREHLLHMASLARFHLAAAHDKNELERMVTEFNQKLSSSRGAPHRLVVKSELGVVLATSDPGGGSLRSGGEPQASDRSPRIEMRAPSLRVEVPLVLEDYKSDLDAGKPARLVLYESLGQLQGTFRTSLLRHLGFGAGLVGLAMLAAGILSHRLVVRPVRELVAATDEIAQDGAWGPIRPSERRQDEIGALEDHLAEMSRRLIDAVRTERYGSAHLVAERVRRELEEPLRRATMELTALEGLLRRDSDSARACAEIAANLKDIAEVARRLGALPASPPR